MPDVSCWHAGSLFQHAGTLVATCRIRFPNQGTKPGSPALGNKYLAFFQVEIHSKVQTEISGTLPGHGHADRVCWSRLLQLSRMRAGYGDEMRFCHSLSVTLVPWAIMAGTQWSLWIAGNPPSTFFFFLKWRSVSHSVLSNCLGPHGLQEPTRLLCPWNSPGKNTGVGWHSLLQGIFPTWGSNPHLLYCRQILYHLSYQQNGKCR